MRRVGKILAWTIGILIGIPLVLVVLVLIAGNIGPGRRLLETATARITTGEVQLSGLGGRFPDHLTVDTVILADAKGAYADAHQVAVDWSPLTLLHGRVHVEDLRAATIAVHRLPESGNNQSSSGTMPTTVDHLRVDHLDVAGLLGHPAEPLAMQGSAALTSSTDLRTSLRVHPTNGAGRYDLDATIAANQMHVTVQLSEPQGGWLSRAGDLPALGAINVSAKLDGPRDAVAAQLTAEAGPLRADAHGTLDLDRSAANLDITASAPAMSPRADVAWQAVDLRAHVSGPLTQASVNGQLKITALRASTGSATSLAADVNGDAGQLTLHATLEGLQVPGAAPDLFAATPILLDATARLDAPDRPVRFTLRHDLVQGEGTLHTAGTLTADATITLPQLAAFAPLTGIAARGKVELALHGAQHDGKTDVTLHATAGIADAPPPAQALLGDSTTIDLAASIAGSSVQLTKLAVDGRNASVTATGSLEANRGKLAWQAHISDLAVLRPGVSGRLDAEGVVDGPFDNLAAKVTLRGNVAQQGVDSGPLIVEFDAHGLPNRPGGDLLATGALLGAPVNLAASATWQDGGLQIAIQRGNWQSLHAEGNVLVVPPSTMPQGKLQLRMTRLADLAPLFGQPIKGSLEAGLDAGADMAKLTLRARELALAGTAAVTNAQLDATVQTPATHPVVDAALTMDGASAGNMHGSGRITARGPADALRLVLSANSPSLANAPARIEAAGTADTVGRNLALTSFAADWRGRTLRLLAPTQVRFADGLMIEHLRLGLDRAVLALNGRISPALDFSATLRDLPAALASIADPTLDATGTINAEARLTGTTARPTGTIRVTASALRVRNGPGAAMPAARMNATAALAGTTARIDVAAAAGTSRLTVRGDAPLSGAGALALRAGGKLDLSMLDPVLTAQGRRLRGEVQLDVTIGGSTADPRVTGAARLIRGEAQDFAQGLHLTDMTAALRASGTQFQLTDFSAHAGPGTLHAQGTLGLATGALGNAQAGSASAPGGMPVNLTVTADNARLLATTAVTATLDAKLALHGDLAATSALNGTVQLREADVNIPDKTPANVAVLPVRIAGAPAPRQPPAEAKPAAQPLLQRIGLDLTLDAPARVFVRGRGVDAELAGNIRFRNNMASPQPTGGLTLRRGAFSVAGHTLTFTSGSVSFTGAGLTDPALDLVATTTSNAVTATLTITGTAQAPKIILTSVPEMPQDEILAQLFFKQSTASLSPFQIAEIGSALAELTGTGSGIGDPLANLRKTLGLDQLSVGSTAGGAPTLQAGRYVAPRVYVGATQGTGSAGTAATVQVDITKGLKLKASGGSGAASATGDAAGGQAASIGLSYQFEY